MPRKKKKIDNKVDRKGVYISFPRAILDRIDKGCVDLGISRVEYLCRAAGSGDSFDRVVEHKKKYPLPGVFNQRSEKPDDVDPMIYVYAMSKRDQ